MVFGRRKRSAASETSAGTDGDRANGGEPAGGAPGQPADEALEAMRENWLRAAAELDNMRKRSNAKIQQTVLHERRVMLAAFTEVVDSLDHALAAHDGEDNEWVRGTRSVRAKALEVLRQFGAQPFRSKGVAFDPERHEAVARRADPDAPDGAVLEVLQTGYEMRDGSLLRAARVVVNQREEETTGSESDKPV